MHLEKLWVFKPRKGFFLKRRVQALSRMAWVAFKRNHYKTASYWFQKAIEHDLNETMRDQNLFWLAMSELEKNEVSQSQKTFNRLIKAYPISYYSQLGRRQLEWFRGGGVAGDIATNDVTKPLLLNVAGGTESPLLKRVELQELKLSREQQIFVDRYDILMAADQTKLAGEVLSKLALKGLPESDRLQLAERFFRAGDYYRTYRTALVTTSFDERNPKSIWLPYLYPKASWGNVHAYSMANGIDPYLVLSIMRKESLYQKEITSVADAHGLMQLMPQYARQWSPLIGIEFGLARELFDPELNIRIAALHLGNLFQRYNGNHINMVAAYNGSETALERWRRTFPGLADPMFVEEITYGETKNYVKQVLKNLYVYHQLYTNTGETTAAADCD